MTQSAAVLNDVTAAAKATVFRIGASYPDLAKLIGNAVMLEHVTALVSLAKACDGMPVGHVAGLFHALGMLHMRSLVVAMEGE